MNKSFWFQDNEQNGNFSNNKQDTFDPQKKYIGIRLQQGVPLLDRDWNELEDIRRYADVILKKYYIGNGTPDDGFKITHPDPHSNDFMISSGRFLVDGFEVVNAPQGPDPFIMYSQQEGVPELILPDPVGGPRNDYVYLDVWVEEVNSQQDAALKNLQDIDIETCVRHKLNWKVLLSVGVEPVPADSSHHVHILAKYTRMMSGRVVTHTLTDLRISGLSVVRLTEDIKTIQEAIGSLSSHGNADAQHVHSRLTHPSDNVVHVLEVNNEGKIGIDTDQPKRKVHIQGNGSGPFNHDGLDRPGLAITGHYPEITLWGNVNNPTHGSTIRFGGYNDDTKTTFKQWVIGTSASQCNFLDIGFSHIGDPNAHNGIRNYLGSTVLTLTIDGRAGICKIDPQTALHVYGRNLNSTFESLGNESIVLFKAVEGGEEVYFGNFVGGTASISVNKGTNRAFNVLKSGDVGIGTLEPRAKLAVVGGGAVINRIVIGANPSSGNNVAQYSFIYETIGSADNEINLRLQTYKDMYFHTKGSSTPAMVLDANGNLGINSYGFAPRAALDVYNGGAIIHGVVIGTDFNDSNFDDAHFTISTTPNLAGKGLRLRSHSKMYFYTEGSAVSSSMFIDGAGNIGIGTEDPRAKLQIPGGGAIINGVSIGTYSPYLPRTAPYPADPPPWAHEAVGTAHPGYNLRLHSTGNIFFHSGPSLGEYMLLDVKGNLGIGTQTPRAKMEIAGGGATMNGIVIGTNLPGITDYTEPQDTIGGAPGRNLRIQSYNAVYFHTNGSKTPGVVIDPVGNIGINASERRAKLDIQGGGACIGVVVIGTNNPKATNYTYSHETIGSSETTVNLRLQTYGNIFFHTGGDSTPKMSIADGGTVNMTGDLYVKGVKVSSDISLKTGITPVKNALPRIAALQGIHFKWNDPSRDSSLHMGFIAQDVEKIFPELVSFSPDGYKYIDYAGLTAPLIEALKTQQQQLSFLSNQNQKQQDLIDKLLASASGNDYAEYFESQDAKPIKPGTSVVFDNNETGKIRPAKKGETPFGIISANPGISGGIYLEWPDKYLRDTFGQLIMEEYPEEIMIPRKEVIKKERRKTKKKTIKDQITKTEIAFEDGMYFKKEIVETVKRIVYEPVFEEFDLYDAEKKNIVGKHRIPIMEQYEEETTVLDENGGTVMIGSGQFQTKTRPKLNPDFDPSKEYIPRDRRPEWNCVGLLGQLALLKGQPTAPSWIKIKDLSDKVELWLVK